MHTIHHSSVNNHHLASGSVPLPSFIHQQAPLSPPARLFSPPPPTPDAGGAAAWGECKPHATPTPPAAAPKVNEELMPHPNKMTTNAEREEDVGIEYRR
jgi:hypothetical protein